MDIRPFLGRMAFGSRVRQRTWKKLAAQVHNGIPLSESMGNLLQQTAVRNASLAHVFRAILMHMASGHNLGTALTGYATPEEIMLISSGQKAGKLEDGLRLATELLVARQKIVSAVVNAVTYPLFLGTLCLVLLTVVSTTVIPQLALLADPTQWTGAASVLYSVASFVGSPYGMVTMCMVVVTGIAALLTLPLWTGPRRLWVEGIPPWSMYRLTVGSVWLFTMATLMRSGMQVSEILENTLASDTTTPYLHERVEAIAIESRAGQNIGEAMFRSGMGFPDPELVDDMRVYAPLPNFQTRLYSLASDWMTDGVELIQQNARVLNTVFLTLIISQVLGLALAVVSLQTQLLPQ